MQIRFSADANRHVGQVIDYYFSQGPRLGRDFQTSLKKAVESLKIFWMFEIKYDDIRTYRVQPFPYRLHYRIDEDAQAIVIEALLHERSDT